MSNSWSNILENNLLPSNYQKKTNEFERETFLSSNLEINSSLSNDLRYSDHGRFDCDDSRLVTTTDEQSQFKSSCDSTFGMVSTFFLFFFFVFSSF